MMAAVGLGIVGLGRLGSMHARHLRHRVPGARLCRVADADQGRARSLGDELRVAWTDSAEDLLADPALEGVVIAASTSAHAQLIECAAAAGRHVFTEKPIALTRDETVGAIEATRAAGTLLQVGFHRRFDPDFEAAKARVAAGDLGRAYLLRISHRDMKAPPPGSYLASDGDLLVDATVHDFDTARWLFGEVEAVDARGAAVVDPRFAATGDVDVAVVVLRFANGALGVIDNLREAGYGYECSLEAIGSRGAIRIPGGPTGSQWLSPGGVCVSWPRDHTQRHREAYVRELAAFAAAIREGAASPVPGVDGLVAYDLACKARASMNALTAAATTS